MGMVARGYSHGKETILGPQTEPDQEDRVVALEIETAARWWSRHLRDYKGEQPLIRLANGICADIYDHRYHWEILQALLESR